MEHGVALECSVDINAPCQDVFDVIHDYGIRLQWDTLLSDARIIDEGVAAAAVGVSTLCVGRTIFGRVGIETVYVSFDRPRVAAVRMKRGPWFLADFAASIRHSNAGAGSRVVYKLRITTQPRWLQFLLDPLLKLVFRLETQKRLNSLKRYIEARAY